jgi:hypothetical protein
MRQELRLRITANREATGHEGIETALDCAQVEDGELDKASPSLPPVVQA